MSLEDEVTVDVDARFAAEWNEFVQRAVRARWDLIEQVCRLAYTQDLPYGVLVDCDGVRIDKDVPALTIHYRDQHCGPEHTTFAAVFTVPE